MIAGMKAAAFEVVIDYTRCGNCGGCVAVCPESVLHLDQLRPVADNSLCTGCKRCVIVCPNYALSLNETTVTIKSPAS